ncbi:MAG TPA: S-layer homology domain-containing protein [Syntrophomonadaceae bacterium]|nr:S-layer homology domain-containing protein [Syntrophomonadaceae bacterium]
MKRRYLSILLVMTMIFFVTGGFAVPAKGALLPYTATLTITPSQSEIDVTTGSVDVIYTLKVTPPAGQHIGVFSFDLKAPVGMTLSTTKVSTKNGDGYWINNALFFHEDFNPGGIFATFSYTPVPNGYFIGSGTTFERNMTIEADIMTIKATITDASKAGSYALVAENPNVGPDGTDTFTFDITSTPAVVKDGSAVTSVEVSPATATVVQGGTQQLTATVTAEGGAAETVTWSSSDATGKVTVDGAGLVTVAADAAAGDYTITATSTVDNTKSDTATITVTLAPAVTSVTVTPETATVARGGTQQLTAVVAAVGGAAQTVTWSSSDANGKVTVSESGLVSVTADASVGDYTITATSTVDNTKSDTATITVTLAPAVTSVTVSPETATVIQGGTRQLTATVVAEGGAAETVTWSSSDATGKVTVDGAGLVTVAADAAAGDYTITATSTVDNTKSDTATITVTLAPAVTSVTVTPETATVARGGTQQLTAVVAAEGGAAQTVTWSSNDASEKVAVNATGLVSVAADAAAGDYTITATSTFDNTKFDTTTITVRSNDASITGVTVDGEVATVDSNDSTKYNVALPFGTVLDELIATDIVVTKTDANATVGQAASSDGGATWTVVVTAQDETTSVTYTINATVLPPSSNNNLGSLTLKNTADNQPISFSFDPATTSYDITVPYTTEQVTITATVDDPTASLLINGMQSPATITLSQISPDTNHPSVVVTAQNDVTKTYTLNITRTAPSSAKSITGFSFTSPAATGTIDEANHTIAVEFPFGTDVTAVIPTISLTEFSTVEPASGVAQDFTNPVTYTVTAQDDTSQVYTVTVTVAPASTNNNLNGLVLKHGNTVINLDPSFASDTTTYSANVVNSISSVTITPTVADVTAVVKVNGITVNSGFASPSISLPKTGTEINTITIEVTAQNDTTKTYAINVTRAASSGGGGGGGGAVAPTVAGIEIKSAPDKLLYTEGDTLDLTGLEVTLTYSNGNKKYAALNEFDENDITVSPKDGDVLDAVDAEIVITVNGLTAKQAITVNKKETVTPPVEQPVLTDIDGHWAQANIEYLVGIGAIAGYPDETFRPDSLITRAEFAKTIVDAFELTAGSGKIFTDTAEHWAKDYIAIAAANGIVLGYNDTEFGPDDLITREQMAIMIVKAAGLKDAAGELTFSDKDDVSSWAYNWVVSGTQNEIMSGYTDNTFKPLKNATRAEAAAVIYNVLMK